LSGSAQPPECRTCNSRNVSSIGALPEGATFAGVVLPNALPGGLLWRCADCSFVFRDPLLPMSRYEELYRNGSSEVWELGNDRKDFELVRQYLAADGAAVNVLEIGCYTGTLLQSLPKRLRLHGVELNEAAARIAASRGVEIVAASAAELPGISAKFDAIIACDVIEHLENPLAFLEQLRSRLTPQGRLLITTGNSDAWLWNLLGARFWYCCFPEHISFIGTRWLHSMSERVGLRVAQMVPFNYEFDTVTPGSVRTLANTLLYASAPRVYRRLRRSLRGETSQGYVPPGCGATRDHMFCVLSAGAAVTAQVRGGS
jgi:SAM-dependent methyltransferase